eukprot:NODE_3073_length_945_cov_49.416870_g3053_i0.p1 GENE.NODE_3073_length_945_cov_49.416870_g3053_i0~~NODE_3073_length_945_cov_49.416870_g3053_i0.p1  ORF type:complete len:305 (-),score=57.23 NODE_3073_length_945_cov_49.416870_g3053_i0:31-816(-)
MGRYGAWGTCQPSSFLTGDATMDHKFQISFPLVPAKALLNVPDSAASISALRQVVVHWLAQGGGGVFPDKAMTFVEPFQLELNSAKMFVPKRVSELTSFKLWFSARWLIKYRDAAWEDLDAILKSDAALAVLRKRMYEDMPALAQQVLPTDLGGFMTKITIEREWTLPVAPNPDPQPEPLIIVPPPPSGGSGMWWVWILVALFVVVFGIISCLVYFKLRKRGGPQQPGEMPSLPQSYLPTEGGAGAAQSTGGSEAGLPTKV